MGHWPGRGPADDRGDGVAGAIPLAATSVTSDPESLARKSTASPPPVRPAYPLKSDPVDGRFFPYRPLRRDRSARGEPTRLDAGRPRRYGTDLPDCDCPPAGARPGSRGEKE